LKVYILKGVPLGAPFLSFISKRRLFFGQSVS
jgi:hypothetical protein